MILYRDADVVVVDKPSGVTAHRVDRWAQGGVAEWVVSPLGGVPEATLAHRLDKGTSGALVCGRSEAGTKALAAQWEALTVGKRYWLLVLADRGRRGRLVCDQTVPRKPGRGGEGDEAYTEFERLEAGRDVELWEARPKTGRTHQVRVHAARLGMPIVGDVRYQGAPGARVFLHSRGVAFAGVDGGAREVESPCPESFGAVVAGLRPGSPKAAARVALEARVRWVGEDTNAFVWVDRHHDGFAEVRVERLGGVAWVVRYDGRKGGLSKPWVRALAETEVEGWAAPEAVVVTRRPGEAGDYEVAAGSLESAEFEVEELGLRYGIDLKASATSTGLFLDQRETRRRLLGWDLTGARVLNAFSHTGALSVAAARAGAETTSLDLSKRYLEWGKDNLRRNGLDPAGHDFIYGDALEWMKRLGNKGRRFEGVLVDPPSYAKGRRGKAWSVERDLGRVVERAARLVVEGGWLYISTNLARLKAGAFERGVEEGLAAAGRGGALEPWTVPWDHRSGAQDPPYLKGAWVRLDQA